MLLYRLVPPQKVRKFVVTCVISVGTSNQHAGKDKPAYLDRNIFPHMRVVFGICWFYVQAPAMYRSTSLLPPPPESEWHDGKKTDK